VLVASSSFNFLITLNASAT